VAKKWQNPGFLTKSAFLTNKNGIFGGKILWSLSITNGTSSNSNDVAICYYSYYCTTAFQLWKKIKYVTLNMYLQMNVIIAGLFVFW